MADQEPEFSGSKRHKPKEIGVEQALEQDEGNKDEEDDKEKTAARKRTAS